MPTTTSAKPKIRPLVWVGLLVLYVVWGSTYLGIAVAIETIPPFLMGAIRFAIAGALLLAWSAAREGRSFRLPTRREWRDTAIVGTFLLGGGMGMVAWGEQSVPSGIAALLVALLPMWVAVLGRIFFGERLPRIAGFGILVGIVGVAILVNPTGAAADRFDPAGVAALVVSPMMWAAGSLFASHRARLPERPLVATACQMLAGSVVLAVMGLASGEAPRLDPAAVSRESIAAVLYLTFIGSILAFSTYGWLLRVAPLPLIATYAYVNPVVAVLLGWLALREPITPRTLVAGGVILVAVAVIINARSRMARPAAAADADVAAEAEAAAGPPPPPTGDESGGVRSPEPAVPGSR